MALRRWLAGCAAGAALAATGLAGTVASPAVTGTAGATTRTVPPAGATTRTVPNAPPSTAGPVSAACPRAPIGYSTCLVDLLARRGASRHPAADQAGPKSAPDGYSPHQIATAYGFATTGGAGSTLAIVDAYADPTLADDLAAFSDQYGLRPCTASNRCLTTVNETGGSAAAPAPDRTTGWSLEASLDVEWAHALAPEADILLVEATSNSNTDLFAAVRYAATKARYVAMAWGGTELAGETTLDATFADPGVSYFAAAGDSASAVSYPATSPDVVAVGGTTLTVTPASGAWESETAWATAGGGCSVYETAAPAQADYPSYDQQGARCGGMRAVPDISLDANPSTGVAVYDTDGYPGWLVAGGTSASADMVAAHAAETGRSVDATDVYGAMKVYNVTTGSNGHPCETGYNLCSGLGSWNVAVGSTSSGSPGTSAGAAIGFTSRPQQLGAGSWSNPIEIALSKRAPASGTTVSVISSSATGELSTSPEGSSPGRSLSLHVLPGQRTPVPFYYQDTKTGTPTIAVSAPGWTSATQTETVTAADALAVRITTGSPVLSGRDYHVPLTATVTSSGRPVSRAGVTITVSEGSCTGARVASGSGSTDAGGKVVFSFSTETAGSYCTKVSASAPGTSPGSATAQFTVSAALPPVADGPVAHDAAVGARVGWARAT